MGRPTEQIELVLATSKGQDPREAESLARRVLEAWPARVPRPRIVLTAIDELDKLGEKVGGGASKACRVILTRADGKSALRTIQRATERIGQKIAGGIVLCPPDQASSDFDGLMAEPNDTDPQSIAHTLAMMIRQRPVVTRLNTELRVAQTMIRSVQKQLGEWNEEMRRAAMVQREFMPPEAPKVDGLDIGVLYRPAGQVSGDIYDIRRLDERTLGFFIADAVGHGMPAALHTLVITRSLRMTEGEGETRRILSPSESLSRLNRELVDHPSDHQKFATAVYGVMDIPTRRVRLSGAGHPPALVVRGDSVQKIETDGPLLGVFDEAEFNEAEFTLSPGSVLVMYSDGFEVAFPEAGGDDQSLKRPTTTYLDRLGKLAASDQTLAEMVESLGEDLGCQAGSLHQADDVTAMMISAVTADAGDEDSVNYPFRAKPGRDDADKPGLKLAG